MLELSRETVRAVMIGAQGLLEPRQAPAAKKDVRRIIRQIHMLQIDTIHVVARSPYLVLWSRLGDYEPRWLDELLAEGRLFEYWAHAACFLPMEDYPLYRRLMLEKRIWHGSQWQRWHPSHADLVAGIESPAPPRLPEHETANLPVVSLRSRKLMGSKEDDSHKESRAERGEPPAVWNQLILGEARGADSPPSRRQSG